MLSVRDILAAVFMVLIAASTCTAWFLADMYNRRNTDSLAVQIQREVSNRINDRIQDLVATPHQLNALGDTIIQGGQLNFDSPESVNRVFHGVLTAYPHINALFYGSAGGEMYGARWNPRSGVRDVMVASESTQGSLNYYQADTNGFPGELVESAPAYDPRSRSWFLDAVGKGGPVWSPIYLDFATRAPVMTAALPVYDPSGALAGVMGCGIKFTELDQFLQSLAIGTSGIAYIMEKDGTLLGTSTTSPTYNMVNGQPERLDARASSSALVAESARLIHARLDGLRIENGPGDIRLDLDGTPTYASLFRISDDYGLDWVGVVVVPESDFTAVIEERNRVAFAAFVVVIFIALLAGLISTRVLTRPLAQLSNVAENIANDVWDTPLEVARKDEFGAVARAFDHMRRQLHKRIQDLRETRNALEESEEHYARALEAAGVIAWSWTVGDDEIKWTEQGEPILGASPGDHRVPVRDFLQRVHPEDRNIVARSAAWAIQARQEYNLEYRIQLLNGEMRWVASHGKVIRDSTGAPTGMTGVILDISQRKQLEAQLLESQRLEAVGRLAGGIAHDFNNLLQAILGFTDMARDAAGDDANVTQELDEVIRAAERARELVRQLLAFSRRQLLNLGFIALDEVVGEMGKMLARLIDETIDLQYHRDAHNATIRADRGQVEQILINLCVNARDAMPDGGTLEIRVASVELSAADCEYIPRARPGRFHRLRVRDSGVGMDKETIRLMFEPFFTTKDVGKGTGLGMATVYGIVEQHRGFLHVTSSPGAGTTVDVYFEAEDAEAEPVEEPVQPALGAGGGTILLAEDDIAVRTLARRVLERAGYEVIEAADGDAAIAAFEVHRGRIDAAFLDVVMPGKNGKTVLEVLRKYAPKLPVLFASGYAEGGVHTDFILEEGLTLVQKPYSSKKLLAALQSVLGRASDGNTDGPA